MEQSAGSDPCLHCLPISFIKHARLTWLKNSHCEVLFSLSGKLVVIQPSVQESHQLKGSDGLPSEFVVHLPLKERNITLLLQRNYQINWRVPVTVERYGKIIDHQINDPDYVGFYHDVNHGCSIMVQRGNCKGQQQNFEFFGTVHVDSISYLIQPPDNDHDTHSLTEVQRTNHNTRTDYIKSRQSRHREDLIQNVVHPKDVFNQRQIRRITVYEIEVLVVVDFSVYSFWRNRLHGTASTFLDTKTKKNLRQYYALLLHSADLYFKSVTGRGYAIKLLFAGLHVSDKGSTSPWTETVKNVSTSPVSLNSSIALDKFNNWANSYSNQLPSFDHALLFTRYEMHYTENGTLRIDGLGYESNLCYIDRVSLI